MKYCLLSLSLLILLVSCQKTSDTTSTREDDLRNGKWKLVKMSVVYKVNYPVPHDSTLPVTITSCKEDDFLTFGPGFNGGINSGSSKCSPADPDITPFSWEPVNNDNGLNIYGAATMFGSNTINATLKNFTPGSFTLSYYTTVQDPMVTTQTDTITYNANMINF
jgi:hypothetical protein